MCNNDGCISSYSNDIKNNLLFFIPFSDENKIISLDFEVPRWKK